MTDKTRKLLLSLTEEEKKEVITLLLQGNTPRAAVEQVLPMEFKQFNTLYPGEFERLMSEKRIIKITEGSRVTVHLR